MGSITSIACAATTVVGTDSIFLHQLWLEIDYTYMQSTYHGVLALATCHGCVP